MSQGLVGHRMRGLAGLCAGTVLLAGLSVGTPGFGQGLTPEEAGAVLLNSANAAYNDGNYAVAIDRFRAYLQQFPSNRLSVPARYGLGLALLDGPSPDYQAAMEALQPVVNRIEPPNRAFAQYYFGMACRGVGLGLLGQAPHKPNEAQELEKLAAQRFTQAAASFDAAAKEFASAAKGPPAAEGKALAVEFEWMARARCDQAEMLLRLGRAKEAAEAAEAVLKDPVLAKSRYRRQALYEHGYAHYLLEDYVSAVRSLSALAPFDDSQMSIHAQYLLARIHDESDQPAEAGVLYERVQQGHQKQRKAAEDALKNSDALKERPEEKSRLQSLLSRPLPEYVARAGFYGGVLLYERGQYAEALAKFTTFFQQSPRSALAAEARLRQGLCQLRLKQHAEAIKCLAPLQEHPRLGDQALLWLARAQIAGANPTDLKAYDQALKEAMEKLVRAAERLKANAADPDARRRRGEVLLELGDAQRLARQYKEAAATYQIIVDEKAGEEALEEAMHGIATVLQLAGLYKESDEACVRFQQTFGKSTLLPAIAFRYAENPYLAATHAMTHPNAGVGKEEVGRLYAEAIRRYQDMIAKYPGYPHLSLAKQGLASAYYQLGQYEKAAEALNSIPEMDRSGPLASVNYLLADCLLRTLPPGGEDALATAALLAQLEEAANLLTGVMMTEGSPLVPDATIKLGYTLQRMAALIVDPQERSAILQKASMGYQRFMLPLKNHPLYPLAVLEHAKVLEQLGGFGAAVKELNLFREAPLNKSPLATLAMMRLAEGLRVQRKAGEAAALLGQWRQQHESELMKDPARADWVPDLQFGHAMALKDAGQLGEARSLLERIQKQFPKCAAADEIPLRMAQCRREEAAKRMEAAAQVITRSGKPEEVQDAKATLAACAKELTEIAGLFLSEAERHIEKPDKLDIRMQMHYEAAWCYRGIAEVEIDIALDRLRDEASKRLREQMPKDRPFTALRPPGIALSAVTLQPAEIKAREQYKIIIHEGIDVPLVLDAQYELADMHAQRNEHKAAIPLLEAALEQEMAPDLTERVRLRLGASYLAVGQAKVAEAQFNAILKNARTPLMALARYGQGEAAILQKEWGRALEIMLPFRDSDRYRHLPGTSDVALLRLGQIYAQLKQWDQSHRTLDALVKRFPRSSSVIEGYFGIGWALEHLKRYDEAIGAYTQVIRRSGGEVAAKAQLQIGLCRLAQDRPEDAVSALQAVSYTYDYPDITAQALCEAARILKDLKHPDEAGKLLQQVLNAHPSGPWHELAKKLSSQVK